MTVEERFWSKVEIGEPPPHRPELGPCWLWTGATSPNGYGMFWDGEHYIGPHRFALRAALGRPLQPGEHALHHCDNPPCVRRSHLFPGTQFENMHDMARKGRRSRHGPHGERSSAAKLSAADVLAIRASYATGWVRQADLASEFGVAQVTISKIVRGESWTHLLP